MSRSRLAGERGQILPLLAAGLAVALFALTAIVVDVGQAFLASRRLQAGADAAALAGALALPNGVTAAAQARAYANDPANAPGGDLTATVATRCLKSTPSCTGEQPNVVAVTETTRVPLTFGRVLGFDSLTLTATATATHSVATKPLDVALVLDRTGSMSTQMASLRTATQAFLDALDPALARVALVVLPPQPSGASACNRYDQCDYYPLGDGGYVVDHLTSDFARIQADVSALRAEGSTSYERALVAAAAELRANGRAGADRAIVFETDGAANAAPDSAYAQPTTWLDLGSVSIPTGYEAAGRADDVERPCGSTVSYAATLGIAVYTVGFHLSSDQTCYQAPHRVSYGSSVGYKSAREWGIDAPSALRQIAAGSGGASFLQEDGNELAATFAQVATQLQPARLVPDDS